MANNPQSLNNPTTLNQPQMGFDLLANLNAENIFSQGSDFYKTLSMATTTTEQTSKQLAIDNEKTQELQNMLSLVGFQIGGEDKSDQKKTEPQLEIAVRCKEGIFLTTYDVQTPIAETGTFITQDGNVNMHYSPDGKYFLAANTEKVIIRNLFNGKTQVLDNAFPIALGFSTTGVYFFFINKIDKDKTNVHIYASETLEKVFTFESTKYKKETWPCVQFNGDDTLCVYQTGPNILQIKKPKEKFDHYATLELAYLCDHFALSNVKSDPFLVTMCLEKFIGFNKTISKLEIWSTEDLNTPIITTILEKAQEAKMMFSPGGTHLLVWVQTTHDETGKSYYGQANLYYFDMRTKAIKIVPTYEGPLHDVAWNPNGMEFVVISGFMPAGSVLFDNYCTPKFEFGKHHKNSIRWSPLSRFLCLAGFGNLAGDIEIWDVYALKKVGQCKANGAVFCGWSPDGRKLMTAVLFHRLRVDNGIKVFKYNGKLLNTIDYSKTELYEVAWRPCKYIYEDRPASPEPVKEKQETTEGDAIKPKKLFQPKGSMLSEMLKAGNTRVSGPRVLEPDEDFGRAKALEEREKEKEKNPGYESDKPIEENKETVHFARRKMSESITDSKAELSGSEQPVSGDRPPGTTKKGSKNPKKPKDNYAGPRRAAKNPNPGQDESPDKLPDSTQQNPAQQTNPTQTEGENPDQAFLKLVMQLNAPK